MDEFEKQHMEEFVAKEANDFFMKQEEMRKALSSLDFAFWSLGQHVVTLHRLKMCSAPKKLIANEEKIVKKYLDAVLELLS